MNPHGPEKVRKNRFFFFFFFLSGIAQESVIVEKDERTPPTEIKSCKTRHGQVGTSPKPPSPPKKTSHRPSLRAKRAAWPGANGKRRPHIGRFI